MKVPEICPICSHTDTTYLGDKCNFKIFKCKNCYTIYPQNFIDSKQYYDYSDYYSEKNLELPSFVYDSYRNVVSGFEKHRKHNRLLDIGSGAGAMLDVANNMDWDVSGIEISHSSAEFLRKRGFHIYEQPLEEINLPENHFDVITCSEVIEHLPDPKSFLMEISRILSPDGVLWITTPHSCGLSEKFLSAKWSDIYPPEHINIFSIKSLKMCLVEAGFSKFRFVTTGANPLQILQTLKNSRLSHYEKSDSKNKNERYTVSEITVDRVAGNSQINKWFERGKTTKSLKTLINYALNKFKLGDTIKVWATFD